MSWLRSTLTDDSGAYDVAYVSLAGVSAAVISAVPFMCLMALFAFVRCTPTDKLACAFDPQPLGIAIGAACGGYATALGALSAYMLATRRPAQLAAAAAAPPIAVAVAGG